MQKHRYVRTRSLLNVVEYDDIIVLRILSLNFITSHLLSLGLHVLFFLITINIAYGLQVSLKLDIAQDKIMLANTRLSVAAAVIGFAAYFTGTYVLTRCVV